MSIREITQVTDTEINDIKEKSAYSLPNRPTDSGLTAEQIKAHYYEPIVDDEKSIIALMKDKIDEINDALGDAQTEIENVVDNVEDGTTIVDKADKDSDGNKITSTYETKSDATTKLAKKVSIISYATTKSLSSIYTETDGKPFVFTITTSAGITYFGRVSKTTQDEQTYYGMYAIEIKNNGNSSFSYYVVQALGTNATLGSVISSTYKKEVVVKSVLDTNITSAKNYNNATNKPQINSVELSGNKSWSDLGLTKAVLTGIIGAATDSADGYMSSTDHEKLTTLYALLGESADGDSFVNTINEILAIFNNYPEGADLVTALASKVSISDIVDNLTSQATNKPLSANQGYVLDGKIDFLGDGLTNLLNGTSISKKAQQDKDGNDIHSTYIKQSEKSSMEEEMEVSVLEELVGGEVTIFEGTEKEETTNFEDKIDECNDAIASIDSKANVDGNYPTMSVGEADVAKNIKAYSDESGALQDEPFINQPTGTANGTEIVTTGDFCELKSKNGNSVVYNQLLNSTSYWSNLNGVAITNNSANNWTITGTSSDSSIRTLDTLTIPIGHKVLAFYQGTLPSGFIIQVNSTNALTKDNQFYLTTLANNSLEIRFYLDGSTSNANNTFELSVIDLTQWFGSNANIPQDLLVNPSNFFRYYNGSLEYSTGELVHSTGRYLECGQSRNIFNETWSDNTALNQDTGATGGLSGFSTTDWIRVNPNGSYYIRVNATNSNLSGNVLCYYDKDKNFIKGTQIQVTQNWANNSITMPSNCCFIRFTIASTYKTDVCVSNYYTAEQGGEGYNQYYPYKAPILIDTGTETLYGIEGSRDTKDHSGLITRVRKRYTFTGNEEWFIDTGYAYALINNLGGKKASTNILIPISEITNSQIGSGNENSLVIFLNTSTYDTRAKIQTLTSGKTIEFDLATPTTEQGTPYTRYPDINDYSYMLWKDTNNALVTIPQGASIFYPVNYAGYIDDVYARTDGDVTKLALKSEITDSALNTRGYQKVQDLSNDIVVYAGLTTQTKSLYKCGNVYTINLRLQNNTGSDIDLSTTAMCNIGSANSHTTYYTPLFAVLGSGSSIVAAYIRPDSGNITANGTLANGETIRVNCSFILG